MTVFSFYVFDESREDFGLTSHSAIFQHYSDGTVVQYHNFDLLPGTNAMGC